MAERNDIDRDLIAKLHRRREQLIDRINSEHRRLDLIRLARNEAMLAVEDPNWIPPPRRLAHLKTGDAAIVLLVELGGSLPYGILVERMVAEGVNFGSKKQAGYIKQAINRYINEQEWLECTADTESAPEVLNQASVTLSKKFYEFAAGNAKRAKLWALKGQE